ncbi:MAG: hypothetical protein PHQ86_05635 [Dehalococcoidales bacterium]|nr:hypothetical protein [Dehalococcoidales bacterium]
MKIKLCIAILLACVLLLSTVSCGKESPLDYTGSDLSINTMSLPVWIEGTYGSFTLEATGGIGNKFWKGTPPLPFVLDPTGVISGTAPLLDSGTSTRIYPVFTATVIDEEWHAREASFTITVMKKGPKLTPETANVTWDKGNPPASGSLYITTASGGEPPYEYWPASGGGFPPFGMSIERGMDGVSFYLKGSPTANAGTYHFRMSVIDSNRLEATTDVTVQITDPVEEVFHGSFSGPFGGSSFGGTTYAYFLDGDITLTLVLNTDNSISGTAEVPTYVDMTIVSSTVPSTVNPFSIIATGDLQVINNNITGVFVNEHERPLEMDFTGKRSGDIITCQIVFTKTFFNWFTSDNGSYSEDFPTVTTTISNIILTKE